MQVQKDRHYQVCDGAIVTDKVSRAGRSFSRPTSHLWQHFSVLFTLSVHAAEAIRNAVNACWRLGVQKKKRWPRRHPLFVGDYTDSMVCLVSVPLYNADSSINASSFWPLQSQMRRANKFCPVCIPTVGWPAKVNWETGTVMCLRQRVAHETILVNRWLNAGPYSVAQRVSWR